MKSLQVTEVKPTSKWWNIDVRELWKYRDLVMLFVRRDFISVYKQTILGPLWYILRPLLTTITFTVVFGNIAGMSTDGVPKMLFYLAGLTAWGYFSECITKTSDTFIQNANIFRKVYFPRLVMPISKIIAALIGLGIQLLFFLAFWLYFYLRGAAIEPNLHLLLLPVLIIIMALMGLGMGIVITSMTTKYRDLKFLVVFGVQLLMYGSPVIYPLSTVSGKLKLLILANPMTPIIETFKFAFLGKGEFEWIYLAYSAGFSIVIFIIGILLFSKIEKNFVDTV